MRYRHLVKATHRPRMTTNQPIQSATIISPQQTSPTVETGHPTRTASQSSTSSVSSPPPGSPRLGHPALSPTSPLASLSPDLARHPDLSKPYDSLPNVARRLSASSNTSPTHARPNRSTSISSLRSHASPDPKQSWVPPWAAKPPSPVRTSSAEHAARPASSSGGVGRSAPVTRQASGQSAAVRRGSSGEEERADGAGPTLDDLSWSSKWWPFQVVPPTGGAEGKGKGKADGVAPEPSPATGGATEAGPARGLLELLAGKGAVSDAKIAKANHAEADRLESHLLNADLDTLNLAATAPTPPASPPVTRAQPTAIPFHKDHIFQAEGPYREADEHSPGHSHHGFPFDRPSQSPTEHSSYLPTSVFSSRPSASTAKSSLDGPSAMFSSLFSSNPFGPTSPADSVSGRPSHHRSFSSTAHSAKDQKNAESLLDQEDQAAVDDSYMDVFAVMKERYRAPKYPVVFCHGLFGFDYLGPAGIAPLRFSYWIGIKEALEAIGVEVLIGRVPASAGIEERAKVLCEQIEKAYPGREVNLIGHSMGGLDARFLVSRLKPTTFKVKSITTVSTPHRGSSFGDYFLNNLLGPSHVSTFMSALGAVGIPGGGRAFMDLTT